MSSSMKNDNGERVFGTVIAGLGYLIAYLIFTKQQISKAGLHFPITEGQAMFSGIGVALVASYILYISWRKYDT